MTQANDGEKSNYTQNYYDATGNLLRVYTGLHAPLTINGLDNVTAGADTEYAVTKYTYDEVKRLLTTTDALGQVETNTYDLANGLLETTTDRNGQVFNFAYNGLGSITSKALSDGTNAETTSYGLTGQVLSKQNGITTISYVYNDKGQLVSEGNSAAGTIKSFTYDSNGNRTGFTLTRNGETEISQSYTYDLLNRLTSISENGAVIASYSYDANDNRTQTTVTGGETTNYAYNIANMLTSQATGDKLSEQYTYYLNGNQKSKTSNGTTTNYEYDKMNRLISENDTDYSFDDFGNRISMTDGTVTTSYTYDLNNRLSESNEVNGDITTNTKFFYDNNGNQITKAVMVNQPYAEGMSGDYTISNTSDSFVALYEYNCYNQLVGVDTNGVVSSYAYAPDGLRHSKTVGGNTTTFVYDNANIVQEITADGTNKYYRGIEIIKNDNDLYYLYNGQGDVAFLTDAAGTSVADYVFDAYGNQSEENTIYNPFGYRGEYTDAESGLVYLRARMYDPQTGRFINEDPVKDGSNWYMYCGGNPIFYTDFTGYAKEGDDRFSQSVRDEIAIYGQVWSDAEVAYSLGIIDYYEKVSVQSNAENRADEIRYQADHPIKTFFSNAVEFAVFDVLLGDLNGGTVYAADLSGPALEKMYGNLTNLESIVNASPMVAVAAVASSDKGRTLVNTKINGSMTRVDIEFPQGGKPANLHIQIKGKNAQKVMINSMDDLAKLPKSVGKNTVIKKAVEKGLKLLGKLF